MYIGGPLSLPLVFSSLFVLFPFFSSFFALPPAPPGFFLPFYARKQLCFQRVLAIAILSVRPSVCHTGGSGKTVQARISKSSPSAAWKTVVSGTVKLFHKFEGGHPE